jgi:ketosteroid isomerase-like protein
MKRMMFTLTMIALCACAPLAHAQPKAADAKKPAPAANPAVDEIKQIENDWTDAQKTKNADKLTEILADNWMGVGWDGQTSDKAKALADLKSPTNSLDSIQMGPMKVRFFGNVAVVTGSDTEKSKEYGKDSSGKYVWTDVFVKQNGKWRAVASQSAKVPN